MKNRLISIFLVIGMVGLLVGCSKLTKATLSEGTYVITATEQVEDILNEEGTKILSLNLSRPVFDENENLQFVIDYIDKDYEDYISYVKNHLYKMAVQNLEFMSYEHVEFTAKRDFEIVRNGDGIISIVITSNEYTGGAHGSSAVKAINFDVKNQKVLKLEDVFETEEDKYIPILEEKVKLKIEENKKTNEIEYYEEYEDRIKDAFTDETFYITNDEIVFIYNEYLITPYSEGIQEISVDLSSLKEILDKELIIKE